ncbi:MAG: choice-of-anchor B family protein [Calditrichia bacterium]
MKTTRTLFFIALLILGITPLFSQGSPNVTLLQQFNLYPNSGYSDVWGYTAPDGREYALHGVRTGTSIIDISDDQAMYEVTFIPNATSDWKDIKVYQEYAYVVNEETGGMEIIDLSNLPNSASVVATYNGFSTSHNIFIDESNGILYAEGGGGGAVKVLSLANPENPVQIESFAPACHDIFVQDNMMVLSEGNTNTFSFWDMANPLDPQELQSLVVPSSGYCHNAWLDKSGDYLVTTEETTGNTIKIWDVSDLGNITLLDEVLGPNNLAHNAFIKGSYIYLSHYSAGLRIYDMTDPSNVTEIGFYDTYPNNGGGFKGAWGAFPFFASGKILISDTENGLFVVYFEGAVEGDLLDPAAPLNLSAYSDYITPGSVMLDWNDPTSLNNGNPIDPTDFTIDVLRDGNFVSSVNGGVENYTDTGVADGQSYVYSILARVTASDSTSRTIATTVYAGGAPEPAAASVIELQAGFFPGELEMSWQNSAVNIDGTPMDDFAAINVYEDGTLLTTFSRSSADTGATDSASFAVSPGTHSYYITVLDNETPQNESVASNLVTSPLALPFNDTFEGGLNTSFYDNQGAEVNNLALNPPSGTLALNLNGTGGGDVIALRPVDLSGAEGQGYLIEFWYQPQGTGDDPEWDEYLLLECRNDAGNWIPVYQRTGEEVKPFEKVTLQIDNLPNSGGTLFYTDFQVRFRSFSLNPGEVDDWFIDDFYVGPSLTVGVEPDLQPLKFELLANYPNPFNPTTSIPYRVAEAGKVTLIIYNSLGQHVRTLVNATQQSGSYSAVWDGRDDSGEEVVSGIYLYRLQENSQSRTRKMVLLK